MSIASRLKDLGLTLPTAPTPVASYLNCVRTGNLIHVSGGLPFDEDTKFVGQIPTDLSIQEGQAAARLVILNRLAVLQAELGSLDLITRIVSLQGFVNSPPGFHDHPQVINGASELLIEIFGEIGKHSRIALGASGLPLNAAVEISLIAEVSSPI